VAAVIYAIIPFDFIPDMIPFVGQVDDLFLISLTLLRLIDHTDDMIVREHWRVRRRHRPTRRVGGDHRTAC